MTAASVQVELRVEKVVPGGLGLCRLDGQIVFVDGVLPGELVSARLEPGKGGYRVATLVAIVEPAPGRVAPPCPAFGICGGCAAQYADYPLQLALKKDMFVDALRRQGGFDAAAGAVDIEVVAGEPFSYRNRLQFHAVPEEGGAIGFRRRASGQAVALRDCPIAVEPIRAWMAEGQRFVATTLSEREADFDDADERGPVMRVFCADGRLSVGDVERDVVVGGERYRFATGAFFQSNVEMLARLLAWIEPRIPQGGAAWDLYAGCGVFTRLLEKRFAAVSAVECSAASCRSARLNGNPAVTTVHERDVDRWLDEQAGPAPDFAIVDPPRGGISAKLSSWLVAHPVARLLYVSCNPVTFSRDLKLLRAGGYEPRELALFDFYPQTWHMETACVLDRVD